MKPEQRFETALKEALDGLEKFKNHLRKYAPQAIDEDGNIEPDIITEYLENIERIDTNWGEVSA